MTPTLGEHFFAKIWHFLCKKTKTTFGIFEFAISLILQFLTVIIFKNISSQIYKGIFIDYFHRKKLGKVNKIYIQLSYFKSPWTKYRIRAHIWSDNFYVKSQKPLDNFLKTVIDFFLTSDLFSLITGLNHWFLGPVFSHGRAQYLFIC